MEWEDEELENLFFFLKFKSNNAYICPILIDLFIIYLLFVQLYYVGQN